MSRRRRRRLGQRRFVLSLISLRAAAAFPLHTRTHIRKESHTERERERAARTHTHLRAHIMSAWFICHKSKQARAHARCLCAPRVCERESESESEQTWRKGWVICLAAALLFICSVVLRSLARLHVRSLALTHSLARVHFSSALPGHSLIRSLCVRRWCVCVCVWVTERARARSLSLSLALCLADFNGRSEVFIVGTQYSQVAFLMPSAAKPAPFFTQTQHTHAHMH